MNCLSVEMPDSQLPYTPAPFDFAAAFGRAAPLVLEIGFGMGDATAAIAQARRGAEEANLAHALERWLHRRSGPSDAWILVAGDEA